MQHHEPPHQPHQNDKFEQEKSSTANKPQSIAERLLQQCLVPVPPVSVVQPSHPSTTSISAKSFQHFDLTKTRNNTLSSSLSSAMVRQSGNIPAMNNSAMNADNYNYFQCKLCHKNESMNKLLQHASHTHNINDMIIATKECMESPARGQETSMLQRCQFNLNKGMVQKLHGSMPSGWDCLAWVLVSQTMMHMSCNF